MPLPTGSDITPRQVRAAHADLTAFIESTFDGTPSRDKHIKRAKNSLSTIAQYLYRVWDTIGPEGEL